MCENSGFSKETPWEELEPPGLALWGSRWRRGQGGRVPASEVGVGGPGQSGQRSALCTHD